jgi:alkylresorcinol/alkylpyrone synthase
MRIAGAASALPRHYYPQHVLMNALKQHWTGRLQNPSSLERFFSNVSVGGRFLAYPLEKYLELDTFGKCNAHWIKAAEELGQQAICRATARAGVQPRDIDALFFVSVTGVASPSIDARLINRMGLSPNLKRIPIFGLGCVAGAAGIARAADYVRAFPHHVAALVSVELCSLTLQRDDLSVANIISAGLFGDGAACAIVAGADCELSGPQILATRSVFYPDTEDVMGWDISEKGFTIVLSADVPKVVQENLGRDVDAFLANEGLSRGEIGSWILHTGGPKVLEATAAALDLPEGALDASWHCLRKTGNLSSASVLFVLEEVMVRRRPAPGTYSILAAMGPGFCAELVLLRW